MSFGRSTIRRLRLEMTVEQGKNPAFPFFIWLNNNPKERLDLKYSFVAMKGSTIK